MIISRTRRLPAQEQIHAESKDLYIIYTRQLAGM
jgi:hypothetical protein